MGGRSKLQQAPPIRHGGANDVELAWGELWEGAIHESNVSLCSPERNWIISKSVFIGTGEESNELAAKCSSSRQNPHHRLWCDRHSIYTCWRVVAGWSLIGFSRGSNEIMEILRHVNYIIPQQEVLQRHVSATGRRPDPIIHSAHEFPHLWLRCWIHLR